MALADAGHAVGDGHEARGNRAVLLGQAGVAAVLGQGGGLAGDIRLVAEAEQVDLRAHQGAVRLVEVQQFQGGVIAGELQPAVHEAPGQALETTRFQVHGQERRVGDDVGQAERLVELDAVEQHDLAIQQGDVAQMDVAVAFADETVGLARGQQRMEALVGALCPVFEGIQLGQIGRLGEQRADLVEVLLHRRHHRFGGAQGMLDRHARRLQVEARDQVGQGVDVLAAQFATGLQFRQQLALRELAHLQGVLDDRGVVTEAWGLFAAADGQDLAVQRGRQALVEAQLFVAEVLAAGQVGEIEKAEVDRFLDLVGVGAGEQNPGNVGFDDLKTLHGVGVEGRILQGGDQSLAHGAVLTSRQEKSPLWRLR